MINRRRFLGTAGGATAIAALTARTLISPLDAASGARAESNGFGTVRLEGDRLLVETHTLTAEWHRGFLTLLRGKASGAEWVRVPDPTRSPALKLVETKVA